MMKIIQMHNFIWLISNIIWLTIILTLVKWNVSKPSANYSFSEPVSVIWISVETGKMVDMLCIVIWMRDRLWRKPRIILRVILKPSLNYTSTLITIQNRTGWKIATPTDGTHWSIRISDMTSLIHNYFIETWKLWRILAKYSSDHFIISTLSLVRCFLIELITSPRCSLMDQNTDDYIKIDRQRIIEGMRFDDVSEMMSLAYWYFLTSLYPQL